MGIDIELLSPKAKQKQFHCDKFQKIDFKEQTRVINCNGREQSIDLKSFKLANRILSSSEIENLGIIEDISIENDILLRFSIKEAVYKSLFIHVRRFISFKEVEVYPQNTHDVHGQEVLIRLLFQYERPLFVRGYFRKIEDSETDTEFWLTYAITSL